MEKSLERISWLNDTIPILQDDLNCAIRAQGDRSYLSRVPKVIRECLNRVERLKKILPSEDYGFLVGHMQFFFDLCSIGGEYPKLTSDQKFKYRQQTQTLVVALHKLVDAYLAELENLCTANGIDYMKMQSVAEWLKSLLLDLRTMQKEVTDPHKLSFSLDLWDKRSIAKAEALGLRRLADEMIMLNHKPNYKRQSDCRERLENRTSLVKAILEDFEKHPDEYLLNDRTKTYEVTEGIRQVDVNEIAIKRDLNKLDIILTKPYSALTTRRVNERFEYEQIRSTFEELEFRPSKLQDFFSKFEELEDWLEYREVKGQVAHAEAEAAITEAFETLSPSSLFIKQIETNASLLNAPVLDALSNHGQEVQVSDNSVFIVHGHDSFARVEVENFLRKLKLQPIVLFEQASRGATVIEKFERESNRAKFAVILLTPDDVGCTAAMFTSSENPKMEPRARQNVVFELGYFFAKLGRGNVAALQKGNIEQPSDVKGIVYISMEDNWEFILAKELAEAGLNVDLNDLRRS